jgi:hypothetical protein
MKRLSVIWGLVLALSSCESFTDYCEQAIDCSDGNELDVDACIATAEAESERASLYGCSEFFENYRTCLEEESKCEAGNFYTPSNRCEKEQREFNSCMSDSLPV